MQNDVPAQARTLAAVRPLLAMARVDGLDLVAVFRCPASGASETVRFRAAPAGASAMNAVLQDTTLYQVRSKVNGLVRGMLGYGAVGRAARKVTDFTLSGGHANAHLSVDDEEKAILGAFRSVEHLFAWSEGRWVHRSVLGERAPTSVERRLFGQAELSSYDREVAARMVVAVAQVHGGITDDERGHLLDIFGDADSLETLLAKPALTAAELAQTSGRPARRAMLTLAWSMALCDEHFDAAEEALLEQFADGLRSSLEERVDVRRDASAWVVEQFLDGALRFGQHDAPSRAALRRLAERIGMPRAQLERAEARYLKERSA